MYVVELSKSHITNLSKKINLTLSKEEGEDVILG
jgi:hypothetical protein